MMLDSHGGCVGGPGDGEYVQPVEEVYQDWEDGGCSLWSIIPLRSSLLGPPLLIMNLHILLLIHGYCCGREG